MTNQYDKSHGSPYDRGSADRYYGRGWNPHKQLPGKEVILLNDLDEIAAYDAGWNEEDDRKDWGRE